MPKSSNTERAKRVNMAIDLLKESGSLAETAKTLSSHYGVSKRQAYRYVKVAESVGKQIPIPDKKIAFTVKLSENLTQEIRQYGVLPKNPQKCSVRVNWFSKNSVLSVVQAFLPLSQHQYPHCFS